jgi:hypothetical protein
MIKPSKAVIAGAAVAGLLTGSFAVRGYAATRHSTSIDAAVPRIDNDHSGMGD